MTLINYVLFKFKPGTTSAQRSQIVSEQRSLFSSVPGLEKVRVGEVLPAPTNGGFEIALCCEFESLQAWERFVGDAKHQSAIAAHKLFFSEVLATQMEV